MSAERPKATEQGFVLPYVLVVIAILAIASTIAAQRLQKASAIVTDMQERTRTERIMVSAETAATYSLLTGNPVTGGYDISPQSPIIWEYGALSADGKTPLRDDVASSMISNLWAGTGELRRYGLDETDTQVDAVVAYRDASGLISLNQASPNMLIPILLSAGASGTEARKLTATLMDYVDSNNRLRPNGAEGQAYRAQNMPSPSNAKLRSYEELGQVMGWARAMSRLDMQLIKDWTTLQTPSGYRQAFAPKALYDLVERDDESLIQNQDTNIIQQLEIDSTRPSNFTRLIIFAPRTDGRYQKRVVDIERFLAGTGPPYRRHWVYETVVLESDLKIYVDPSISSQDGPPPLDELNHVVHSTPLRP